MSTFDSDPSISDTLPQWVDPTTGKAAGTRAPTPEEQAAIDANPLNKGPVQRNLDGSVTPTSYITPQMIELLASEFSAPFAAGSLASSFGGGGATASTGSSGMGIFDDINNISKLVTPFADVLGGAAKSSQTQNNTADQLKLALYNAQQNAQLGAKKFALAAPAARMKTGMAALLSKYDTPTTVNWAGPGSGMQGKIPTYSGGPAAAVRSASNDPQYAKLRDQVMNDELASQMAGGATGGNQDVSVGTPPAVGQSSTGDNILGGASLSASILAALGKLKTNNAPVPAVPNMSADFDYA